MNQRRSYPNSGDFNLDDLFRPEPGQQQGQPEQQQGQQPGQQQGRPGLPSQPGQPEYLGGGPGQPAPAPGGSWGGQQQYAPPQAAAPAPETQYLPPYPTSDPQGGGYPAQGAAQGYPPAPQAGYGPADQGYAPVDQGYQQAGYPAGAPAGPGYPAQAETTFTPTTRASSGAGGRRPSSKLIIGGVVAGCAAAGILVAVLVSGGDSTDDGRTKPGAPVAAGSSAAGSGSAGATAGALGPEAKEQAKGLSDLLGTANDSRQAVIGAVASVQKCDKLPESQQALTAAAGQRRDLKTKLAALKTDQLPTGPQLVEQLNQAWEASATADTEYAAWAGDAQAGCDPTKKDNPHYKAAVAASGTATTAKKQASALWNAIAGQAGLATKSDGDL